MRSVAAPAATATAVATTFPAAAAVATAATAATAGALLGTSLIDRQAAAFHFLAVEGGDGSLGFLIAVHFHKTKSLGSSRVSICDDLSRTHRTMGRENAFQVAATDTVTQVANIEFLTQFTSSSVGFTQQ